MINPEYRSNPEQTEESIKTQKTGHNGVPADHEPPVEKPAAQEAPAGTAEPAPAERAEAAESKHPELPRDLSLAQAEFFDNLRHDLAKYRLALTIGPDGEMSAQNSDGQPQSWGNIHNEKHVRRFFGWYLCGGLNKEERLRTMVEMFPENTKLQSELEEAKNETEARLLSLKAKKRARKSKAPAPAKPAECPAETQAEPSTDPDPLPGFSIEETKAFRQRQGFFAKKNVECYLALDGTVYTLTYLGNLQPWMGNIRDTKPNQIAASANGTPLSEVGLPTHVAIPPAPRRPSQFDAALRRPEPAIRALLTEFITGSAGTGKTYEVQRRKAADPQGVILAATTGIAAVNLGPEVTTIHSLLKFFRYNSLVEAYESGRLQHNLRNLVAGGMRHLMVDEISMFSAPALDILYRAFNEVAQRLDHPIKLTLAGDFCQLQPMADPDSPDTAKYAFEANCWRPHFSENTMRLTRNWRQGHEHFISALQAARRGAGEEALAYLQRLGVRFEPHLIDQFEGTTLNARNVDVDQYNMVRLRQMPNGGPFFRRESSRWALNDREPSEWKDIPEVFHFRIGAYVMVLSNDCPQFRWVNGDCGTVVGTEEDKIIVRLKRNNDEVAIGKIVRERTTRISPGIAERDMIVVRDRGEYNEMVRANGEPPRQVVMLREPHPEWITGWIKNNPLRLAYATTVHKSQGLSLDAVQLDLNSDGLGEPAMMYVALSRCRTPEGLVLVGRPEQVVEKTRIDPRVTEWL